MAFLALGDVIVGALYQTGASARDDSMYVWGILAGSSVGLLASTLGRLYASTYYALRDTRTPLRFAVVRVLLTTALGIVLGVPRCRAGSGSTRAGALPGSRAPAGIAGWVEFALLRRSLGRASGRSRSLPPSWSRCGRPRPRGPRWRGR